MPFKNLVLHLGMPKTGSSSIQHTLYNNSSILEQHGFKYLTEWGLNHLDILHDLFSSHPFIKNWIVNTDGFENFNKPLSMQKRYKKTKYYIDIMQKVLNTTKCETLIMSGEFFRNLWLDSTMENIKYFLKKYFIDNNIKVSIIVFVRNPLAWLTSFFQGGFFKTGYIYKEVDYFEARIKQYNGIINLKNNFSDCISFLKFENAIADKDGLVGFFLKTISFPESELKEINIYKINEAKCFEAMEFNYYVEMVEPNFKNYNYKSQNPNRSDTDLRCIKEIKGVKFDFPYQSKLELWDRLKETVHLLQDNIHIDYTDYKIPPPSSEFETYREETIQGFINIFPKLSFILQKHFLKFFEIKYTETSQVRFKRLYQKDSTPWNIFYKKNAFLSLLNLRIKNVVYNIKQTLKRNIPSSIKPSLKRVLKKA